MAEPQQDPASHQKCGVVALIGRPNAGKSTLLNRIVGEKIAIVSDKPQTTRTRISGIVTRPEGQIVFLDTPGIHKPGYELNRRMMGVVNDALSSVDLIMLIMDATESMGAGDRFVFEMLKRVKIPAFLLPNKVDALRDKGRLLPFIAASAKEVEFAEVIPISALKGDGAELLVAKIFEYLPERPLLYPDDEMTDQPERVIVAEFARRRFFKSPPRLPYVTAVVTETWKRTRPRRGSVA
jgi:GTP-binding protein Era